MRTLILTLGTLLLAHHLPAQDSPITVADTSQQGPPFTAAVAKGIGKQTKRPKTAKNAKDKKFLTMPAVQIYSPYGFGPGLVDIFPISDPQGNDEATCVTSKALATPIMLTGLAAWRVAFYDFEIRSVDKKNKEADLDLLFTAGYNPPVSGSGGSASVLVRSEEHTSELQSRRDLVCRLLLEKKKE